MSNTPQPNVKPCVWYAYDALCGWCYGFSPVMQQIHTEFTRVVDFEVLSGGMVRGDRIGAIGEVAPYISWAYKTVEEQTGVRFGNNFLHGILSEGKAEFTSIPAALAMAVFKMYKPTLALQFAHRLQSAIYYDGIQPSIYQEYSSYASEFGIDSEEFLIQMSSPTAREAAEKEFAVCAQLGITGFPTVLIQQGQTLTILTEGYLDKPTLANRIESTLQKNIF
jgi:putative protein-disulfide isomerase